MWQISLLNLLDIVDNKKHNTYVQISRNVRPVYELSNLWKSRYLGKWDSDGYFFCLMSSKHYYSYIIVLFLVHEVTKLHCVWRLLKVKKNGTVNIELEPKYCNTQRNVRFLQKLQSSNFRWQIDFHQNTINCTYHHFTVGKFI
jgi:hypothetical protein